MLTPTYPRILRDRDQLRDWYLDEPVVITLHNGNTISLDKGFRFNGHSVPPGVRWFFPKYKPSKPGSQVNDIYAALVHDAMIDLDPWHPYNRAFEDFEYKRFHNMPEYKMTKARAYWMPLAVTFWGWCKYGAWGDYRGKVKTPQHLVVSIK